MGSSAAITLKGSKVISPVSHSIQTLYLLPFQLGSVAFKGPSCPIIALNLLSSYLLSCIGCQLVLDGPTVGYK